MNTNIFLHLPFVLMAVGGVAPSMPSKPSAPSGGSSAGGTEGSTTGLNKPAGPENKSNATDENNDEEGSGQQQGSDTGNLTSPEGILMLSIAIIFDAIGLFLFILSFFGIGIPLSWILDVFGMFIIGGWMYTRSGSVSGAVKKGLKRFMIAFVIELVPFLGDISPSWTWLVYKTLKS